MLKLAFSGAPKEGSPNLRIANWQSTQVLIVDSCFLARTKYKIITMIQVCVGSAVLYPALLCNQVSLNKSEWVVERPVGCVVVFDYIVGNSMHFLRTWWTFWEFCRIR